MFSVAITVWTPPPVSMMPIFPLPLPSQLGAEPIPWQHWMTEKFDYIIFVAVTVWTSLYSCSLMPACRHEPPCKTFATFNLCNCPRSNYNHIFSPSLYKIKATTPTIPKCSLNVLKSCGPYFTYRVCIQFWAWQ